MRPTTASGEWRSGWPTVFASTIGLSLTTLYVYSTGAFIGPVQAQFGWSRALVTSGLTVATVCAAVVGPLVGAAVDRYGARRIALPGIVLYCAAFAAVSLSFSPASWLAAWAVVGLASAGVKPTLWVAAVSRRFHVGRGLALAITLSGAGLGSAIVPLASTAVIAAVGWRHGYPLLALLWGIVTLPLAVLGIRDRRGADTEDASDRPIGDSGSRRTLFLSWRYQAILIAAVVCTLATMAMVVSLIPLLTSFAVPRPTAARLAATVGVTSIVGRLISGRIIDRVDPRWVSSIGIAMPAAAAALFLAAAGNVTMLALAVGVLGLAVGAELEAAAYLTARYFGLRHFGFLFGVIVSGLALGTGIGPLIASALFDRTGSYSLLLFGTIPLSLLAAGLIVSIGRPPTGSVDEQRNL